MSESICVSVSSTYRRLIPDSGWAEERERVLSSGEGEEDGVPISSSASSLQTQRQPELQRSGLLCL